MNTANASTNTSKRRRGRRAEEQEDQPAEISEERTERVVRRLVRVKSEVIHAVGFVPTDASVGDLVLVLTSGRMYLYADVPILAHAELLNAESIGKYFNQSIRGKFETVELEQELQLVLP